MSSKNLLAYAAAGVAAVALAFGAYAIGSSGSGASGTADASQAGARIPANGAGAQGPRAFGTQVTGATAEKIKAAVLARYNGTIERVDQLPDGSYVAHVLTADGEYHVAVSKDFKVSGVQQGGPGAQGLPPDFGIPLAGAAAAKAKAAALAKYPGTVERVFRLQDGSYVVDMLLESGGEVHVKVSKAFVVTGTEQGPPRRSGGAPPSARQS